MDSLIIIYSTVEFIHYFEEHCTELWLVGLIMINAVGDNEFHDVSKKRLCYTCPPQYDRTIGNTR